MYPKYYWIVIIKLPSVNGQKLAINSWLKTEIPECAEKGGTLQQVFHKNAEYSLNHAQIRLK